ncbi:PREDICTED: zinc transporter ZIP1 isoform X2 [Nicrophorus vespilloides]|uniref:Zinc transporter ZIP1 isoform X2 n=1 Tax=Nicrophorus vespilloides TaxID=110193 RepID=A0ABM1MU28_NICVS|nr:PREDICTED: zinc transporter ZIP1 isoform X2 [Nicrophorus vespilloides]XP_017778078.1 PREDICTED: zinc transporter ZIP1 isoform X2 [Nicrophorus vespilloides]
MGLEMETSDLLMAKLVAMTTLGLASFLIGISPMRLTKLLNIKATDGNNLAISLLLCFGGGVLLFTTFVHLQPEVRESFAKLEAEERIPVIGHGISVSEVIFCLGFFFVYLVEELVHAFLDRRLEHLTRSMSVRKTENMCIPRVTLNKLEDNGIAIISNSNRELFNSQSTVGHHNHMHIDENMKNSFRGLLAVLALSFHAVFEGLAVGLEASVQKVWYLFAAIATHKLVIAFCVGVELVTSKTKLVLILIYIGTFAIVTPLGIGVGIALSGGGSSEIDVTSVVLQGMAAGTLLYVVFFEVLARERSNGHGGIWKLIAIIAGFGVMFTLQILTGHEHSHGGHEHEHDLHETSTHVPTNLF